MRFMALWYPAKTAAAPTPELYAAMGRLMQDMKAAKALVDTGGWDPQSPSTQFLTKNGKLTVTDGPYAEAKEVVAGFVIMQVASKAEAVNWTSRFIGIAGDGRSEMRELAPPPDRP